MITALITGWTPLALASMGALWSELAGALCICVDGFIGLGGFAGFVLFSFTGAPALASAGAAVLCALCAFALAALIRALRLNPFVAGLAFNLMAEGLCAVGARRLFGSTGVLRLASPAAPAAGLVSVPIAGLCAAGAVLLSAAALRFTAPARRLRATGLSAAAVRERGLQPERYVAASWCVAAALAALAGCAMLFRLGAYIPYGSAGRGWLALAAVYMGYSRPFLVAACALALAALSLASSAAGALTGALRLPPALLPALPFGAALVLYVFSCALRKRE